MQKRKAFVWLLLMTLLLTACASKPASPPAAQPGPGAEEPASPEAPDLTALTGPQAVTFEALVAGLDRYLARGEGTVADKLTRLYERWGLRPPESHIALAEADLDGDGTMEVVTALNGQGSSVGLGNLLVIAQREGRVVIDQPEGEPVFGAALLGVADLTGDGAPEIAWSTTTVGAHTAVTEVKVFRWQPGRFEPLPGTMGTTNARLALEGKDLVLTGGTVSSAGAGVAQRVRTDRYRWADDGFRLVDQRFESSPYAYHRLIDGIAAETYGRKEEAATAYREAFDAGREPLLPGVVDPENAAPFGQAVRTYARFRLGAFLFEEGRTAEAQQVLAGAEGPFTGLTAALATAPDRGAGCKAAEAWAEQNPDFLDALNSPFGYNNYRWQPPDLCGPLPPLTP